LFSLPGTGAGPEGNGRDCGDIPGCGFAGDWVYFGAWYLCEDAMSELLTPTKRSRSRPNHRMICRRNQAVFLLTMALLASVILNFVFIIGRK
jgi:hypothetical protein